MHTPDLCLPAPAALSLLRAWRGQTPSGPPRRALRLAPLPLWCLLLRPHGDGTAPDAWLHRSGLASVGLLFAFVKVNSWRCRRSEGEVSSVEDRRNESDEEDKHITGDDRWQTSGEKIEIKQQLMRFLSLGVFCRLELIYFMFSSVCFSFN